MIKDFLLGSFLGLRLLLSLVLSMLTLVLCRIAGGVDRLNIGILNSLRREKND